MGTAAPTDMTTAPAMPIDAGALLTLSHWLSPAYPVGAFSFSHGLDWAVQAGDVADSGSFADWLGDVLAHGAGRNDAILLALAWQCDGAAAALTEVDTLARALAPSSERLVETAEPGDAFCRTTSAIWPVSPNTLTYPVAVGAAARSLDIGLHDTLVLFLQGLAGNLTAAAIRRVPLGQTDAHSVLAAQAPLLTKIADAACQATADDLGGCCFLADIASMRHETQYSRMFRS